MEKKEKISLEDVIQTVAHAGQTLFTMRTQAIADDTIDLYDPQDSLLLAAEGSINQAFQTLQDLAETLPDPEEVGH